MNKKSIVLVTALSAVALAGCGKKSQSLEIIIATDQNQQILTYNQLNPLTLPDGKVIRNGDLKPMWQEVQKELNIKIKDKSNPNQNATQTWNTEASDRLSNADIYGGANLADKIMDAGANGGYFIDLSEHLDEMPSFNQYLKDHPDVKTSITAHNGGIYHIPYIAEIGNYARMLHGRYNWVKIILDGEIDGTPFAFEASDTTKTLNVNYDGYWTGTAGQDNYHYGNTTTDNVILAQNALKSGSTLSQSNAVSALRTYVASKYPNLNKKSDLFLGATATYDFDELVALWRCIKLSPATLSKEASGTAKSDAIVVPYFARQSSFREEYLRLMNFMGGQRVHGGDSYGSRFYIDKDGNLQYSYGEDSFFNRLEHLKNIAQEGLIDEDLLKPTNTTDVRSDFYFKDKETTNKKYGFMIYDFTSSTTAEGSGNGQQLDVIGMLPPVTTTPVSDGEFIHFIENTRSIKPDGWGITSRVKGAALTSALKLFDYLFSEEGYVLQNYGPSYLLKDTTWTRPDGEETVYPEFIDWVNEKATELTGGNMANFLRNFVGSLLAVGYQKEIGFELQSTSLNGFKTWDLYNGVAGNEPVLTCSYATDISFYKLVPPTISLTEVQQSRINDTALNSKSTELVNLLFTYMSNGEINGSVVTIDSVKNSLDSWGVTTYVTTYRAAYNKMAGK